MHMWHALARQAELPQTSCVVGKCEDIAAKPDQFLETIRQEYIKIIFQAMQVIAAQHTFIHDWNTAK